MTVELHEKWQGVTFIPVVEESVFVYDQVHRLYLQYKIVLKLKKKHVKLIDNCYIVDY